jgi:predicted Zn finger-like uncharacterized protein
MSRSKNSPSHLKPRTTYAPMSLATRCTECKTIFRVMEDQLRVSEGWVRCGRCGSVFNGLASLLQLKRDPARPGAAAGTPHQAVADEPQADAQPHNSGPAAADESQVQAHAALPSSAATLQQPRHSAQTEENTNLLQRLGGYFLGTAGEKNLRAEPDQQFAASSSLPTAATDLHAWRDSYLDDWVAETAAGVLDTAPEPAPTEDLGDAQALADLSANAELAPSLQSLLKKADVDVAQQALPAALPTPPRPSFRQALPPPVRRQKGFSAQALALAKPSQNRHSESDDQATGFLPSWSAPEGPVTELVPPPLDQNESSDADGSGAGKKRRRAKASASRQKQRLKASSPLAAEANESQNMLWHSAKEDPPKAKTAPIDWSAAEKDLGSHAAATTTSKQPSFVRRAQSQALWRSTRVRAILATSAVLLSTALGLQMAMHWRDVAAANWPSTKPWLTALCGVFSGDDDACQIQPPKHIADISVESSALVKGDAPNTYQLNLSLRNRSTQAVALPAIELNITNATNQLIARRTLNPSHFRTEVQTLPGNAEMAMSLFFKSETEAVSGYTIEPFYP